MNMQASYTLLIETLADGAAVRAHLVGPDGKTIGMYTNAKPDKAVESACTTLKAMGRHDEARAIASNWQAQQAQQGAAS